MGVDERRDDDRVLERAAIAVELRGGPDRDDPPVLDRDAAVAHGRPLDRDDPVGCVDGLVNYVSVPAYASRRASICAAQRFSRRTEAQIESSKRMRSGTTSKASETGSTVGRMIATTRTLTYPIRRLRRSVPGGEHAESHEREHEDGELEDEREADQADRDEREVVVRPDLDLEELLVVRREEVERPGKTIQ